MRSGPALSRSVAGAAIVIMFGNVFSRLLGFVRDALTAGLFGTSAHVSGYLTALRVQTSIYDLLISGVISAAFIPVFSGIRDDRALFRRVGGTVLTVTLLVMALAMALLEIFARDVMTLLGNGQPALVASGTDALRLLGPAVMFLGLSGVLTALLYARQRFIFPAFSPAIFNLAIVLAALALHRWLGVNSLAIGVVSGAVAQVVLQAYGMRGVKLRLTLALRDPLVRKIGRLYLPVFLGLIVTWAQVWLDAWLANRTGTHSQSYLNFATRIYQLPLGIVATAMSLASLPTLSTLHGAEFRATLARGLTVTLILIVPAVVLCGVLAYPVIALAFMRHQFTVVDAQQTAEALRFYAPGLGFAALDQLLIFAFYAKHDTRTPVIVGVISIACYLVVALATLHALSFRGLALADTVKQISHAAILYVLLRRWQGRIAALEMRGALGKILLAGALMSALCYVSLRVVDGRWLGGTLHLLIFVVGVGGVATTLYLCVLAWLRVRELFVLTDRVRARFSRA